MPKKKTVTNATPANDTYLTPALPDRAQYDVAQLFALPDASPVVIRTYDGEGNHFQGALLTVTTPYAPATEGTKKGKKIVGAKPAQGAISARVFTATYSVVHDTPEVFNLASLLDQSRRMFLVPNEHELATIRRNAEKASKSSNGVRPERVARVKREKVQAPATAAPGTLPSDTSAIADPFGVFRTGNVRAVLASVLADKQWHSRDELLGICNTMGVTSQIYDTLGKLKREKGISWERIDTAFRIQYT